MTVSGALKPRASEHICEVERDSVHDRQMSVGTDSRLLLRLPLRARMHH